MSEKVNASYTLTKPARMVFGSLIIPKAIGPKGKEKGDPKYSATLTFEEGHPDVSAMLRVAKDVAQAKWPGREASSLKFPIVKGEKRIEKEAKKAAKEGRKPKDQEFFKGRVVLDARTKNPPGLAVLDKGRIIEVTDANRATYKPKFYNGCNVVASVTFVAYEPDNDDMPPGVTAYLNSVLFHSDGEKIGGLDMADTFSAFAGTVVKDDPTGGDDLDDMM